MNPVNRLDDLLKERKEKQETQDKIIKSPKYELILNFNPFHELSIDNYLQNYLIDKSKELINLQVNDAIKMGKILEEVSQELGKKGSPEGVYGNFLRYNGINSKTALRLRKRYILFFEAPEHAKIIVSLLTVREIEELDRKRELLDKFYPGITLEEAKKFFKGEVKEIENKKEKDEEQKKEITDIGIYSFLQSTFQDDLTSLPEKKQKQAAKLLEKLEKLVYEE
ncbi:hypothetical protein HMPREF9942_00018 [Fusobacterium animalis F0419]|uniref:Uncharacterized protein n=1 Tax=Fusobacterium animalis F0419 TaxID=999414 RepID=H1HC17_9FUSO|nr:hypothetical protein [Fusobacterium animalis]EHO79642.1 hypothetical protein HMPREF9942_00018 [Fusobacterium animalis F0419]